MKTETNPTTTLIVAQQLRPELMSKIAEIADELKALPPIKVQADADHQNKVVKKGKNLLTLITAERKEITRPLDEAITTIIQMERNSVAPLATLIEIKNKNLADFAKEMDRLEKEEKEKIRRDAEIEAQKEQKRVSDIMALIGKFQTDAQKAVNSCTLETIDAKVKGLTNLKFDKAVYQEFIDKIEALRPIFQSKLAEKRILLQQAAELAKKDANKAAQAKIEQEERERQALEDIKAETAQNTEDAKMDVTLNIQMKTEIRESEIQGGKSVSRPWVLKGVLNLMDVPFEFLAVDEKKVKEAIKSGRHSIPGLDIQQEVRNISRG